MTEQIDMSPMYMVSGEFEQRMKMARFAKKPLEYTPRAIQDITGSRALCERDLCEDGINESSPEPFMRLGRTAVISVDAPIFFAASFYAWIMGGITNPMIVRAFNAARDDETIDRIVTDFHCPGGDVAGMSNLVHAIDKAAAVKPVIAMVQDMAASAAYWMACRCSRIVATPSAMIGSIGAISVYYDDSANAEKYGSKAVVITDATHKSMGHWGVPISEQMIEREMKLVGDMSEKFRVAVSDKRGIAVDELKAMGGSMHFADDALARKLCDEIRDTADFYLAIDAGEYDQYGPANKEESGDAPVRNQTNTSGRVSAQTKIGVAAMADQEIDDKIAAMTDEEKDQELARLMGEEEEPEASTQEEEPEASTQEEEPEASTDEDDNASAMSIKEIKAVIADAGLPKSIASEMVVEAIENKYSEITLYRKCMKAMNSQNTKDTQQIDLDAAGGDPIGGGAGSMNTRANTQGQGGHRPAEAAFKAAVKQEMESNPGMDEKKATRQVAVNQPKLQSDWIAEATTRIA